MDFARLLSVGLLANVILSAGALTACGGSDKGTPPGLNLTLYDDFSTGIISAARWSEGQHQATPSNQAALLSHSISAAQPNVSYGTGLIVLPPSHGEVTTLQTDMQIISSQVTGDTSSRTGIDLWFQPRIDRLGPNHLGNALFARIVLTISGSSLLAQRQLFECGTENCSPATSIGTSTGNWPIAGLPISERTSYTISVSIDMATKVFRFNIIGGAYPAGRTAMIDVSAVTSPFPVDVSAANLAQARLFSQVRGGSAGGGNGSIAGQFDNVKVGVNGGAATLFDDFNAGTSFDSTKWSIGKESVQIMGSGLQITLNQKDTPATVAMNLTNSGVSALQSDVTITDWSLVGQGRLVARLDGALYNDGTNGSGTGADINRPGAQVGDVIAAINMASTAVTYDVFRCDSANCSSFTAVQQAASLGTVTLGSTHTLLMQWDAARKKIAFQLDGNPMVSIDPVAAGYPVVADRPNRPFKQIAAHAAPSASAVSFTGSITAVFANVKTL